MKKITAREFQHHFGRLATGLKPGEALQVTRNGKVDGVYHKAPGHAVPFPDFKARLRSHDYSATIGEAVLQRLDAAVS